MSVSPPNTIVKKKKKDNVDTFQNLVDIKFPRDKTSIKMISGQLYLIRQWRN